MSASAGRSILTVGDCALLVECDSLDAVMALHSGLIVGLTVGRSDGRAARPDVVVDVVPGARTILVTFEHPSDAQSVRRWLSEAASISAVQSAESATVQNTVQIDVQYDGADLAEVSRHTGMSERDVVDCHTRSTWRVAFGGFAPGFAYLVTDHELLAVPRRQTPRTEVPAGSVALAGAFAGVYPRTSPGGWQLIGHTDAPLWNSEREHPALLEPGAIVQFREAT